MHKIKEMLMNELYEYEEKAKKMSGGKISMQELEKIHKLTDTVKNIDKIEMLEDGDYSEASEWMGEGRMFGNSYENGSSYARDGRGRGRNARRDSMGRYSREGGNSDGEGGYRGGRSNRGYSRDGAKDHLIEKAEELLEMAQDPKERRAIEKFIREIEED